MVEARIRKPIILLGAPRSGTTMLFNVLSGHPDLWSLYRESGAVIERQFPVTMTPGCSDVVEADQVDDTAAEAIRQSFLDSVGNMGSRHFALSNAASTFLRTPLGRRVMNVPGISKLRLAPIFSRARHHAKVDTIRMVEKTPENSFRVQLIRRVFPDAMFVYITRDPRPSIASIYTGWTKSTEFRRFRFPPDFELNEYDAGWWSFGLLPGWEKLNGSTVMEVCARQWLLYNQYCRRDLELGNIARTLEVSY
jgi:Sulfotransferase family